MRRIFSLFYILTLLSLAIPITVNGQHFEFVETERNMNIVVNEARINGELLRIDDEIGIFDPDEVCAGATIVDDNFFPLGHTAYGDDPDTDFDEGFEPDDVIAYRFWDHDAEQEFVVDEVQVDDGENIWANNGLVEVRLSFGVVEPDNHFEFWITDVNHTLLVLEAIVNGEPLQQGDEVGVFDPDGICAGGAIVAEPGELLGIAAWGDDGETEEDEGFEDDDEFEFRFWDAVIEIEFVVEYEVEEGPEDWEGGGITGINLSSPGVPLPVVPEQQHDFGSVLVGEVASWSMPIDNEGNGILTVDSVAFEDDGFRADIDQEGLTIEPERREHLEINFEPEQAGQHATIMTLYTNADSAQFEIELTGTGLEPPRIILDPVEFDFGDIAIEPNEHGIPDSATEVLWIRNGGDLTLIITGFTIPVHDDVFTQPLNSQDTLVIAPNGGFSIRITFDPTEERQYESELLFSSNDPGNQEISIELRGTGIDPAFVNPDGDENPTEFALLSAYPNPFNDKTNLKFAVPTAGQASLSVFDVNGRSVFEEKIDVTPGIISCSFSRDEGSMAGLLIARLTFGNETRSLKLVYIP